MMRRRGLAALVLLLAIALSASLALGAGRRSGGARENFDEALLAFFEAEHWRKERDKYGEEEDAAYRGVSRAYGRMPTDAAVKHYAAAARRENMDVLEIIRRDMPKKTGRWF